MREDAGDYGRDQPGDGGGDWFAQFQPAPASAAPPQTAPPGYHVDPNTGALVWDGSGGVPQPQIDSSQPIQPQLPGQTWPSDSPYAAPAAAPIAASAPSGGGSGGGGNQ